MIRISQHGSFSLFIFSGKGMRFKTIIIIEIIFNTNIYYRMWWDCRLLGPISVVPLCGWIEGCIWGGGGGGGGRGGGGGGGEGEHSR